MKSVIKLTVAAVATPVYQSTIINIHSLLLSYFDISTPFKFIFHGHRQTDIQTDIDIVA